MEDEINQLSDYSFLIEEDVEKYFADLNINLLSGKHIDNSDYTLYSLLEKYEERWKAFYKNLYRLNLISDVFDRSVYYYLDFFDSSKGKLNDTTRYKALTEMQTITGLMLLDMYYLHYFENQKIIHWEDIRKQIEESDHKKNYQKIFFNSIRPFYSEIEWQNTEKRFKEAINSFDKLGWVVKQFSQGEELVFEIKPAIQRIAKLYNSELEDLELFIQNLKSDETL